MIEAQGRHGFNEHIEANGKVIFIHRQDSQGEGRRRGGENVVGEEEEERERAGEGERERRR